MVIHNEVAQWSFDHGSHGPELRICPWTATTTFARRKPLVSRVTWWWMWWMWWALWSPCQCCLENILMIASKFNIYIYVYLFLSLFIYLFKYIYICIHYTWFIIVVTLNTYNVHIICMCVCSSAPPSKRGPAERAQVVKRAKLTHVAFSKSEPIIIVGDDRGGVTGRSGSGWNLEEGQAWTGSKLCFVKPWFMIGCSM